MNRLLSIFENTILPILIIAIAIIIAVSLYFYFRKKFKRPITSKPIVKSNPQVTLKSNFCSEDEMKFLEALHKALPRECISFPNVSVSKLVEPKGSLSDYKVITNNHVDICVFLRKDMSPILVIDLYKESPIAQQLKRFDENTNNILKAVKIPVLHKKIQDKYNSEDLLIEVLNSMNATTVSYLKTKSIDNINNSAVYNDKK